MMQFINQHQTEIGFYMKLINKIKISIKNNGWKLEKKELKRLLNRKLFRMKESFRI